MQVLLLKVGQVTGRWGGELSDAGDERLEEQFVKIKGRKIYVVLGNIFG